MGNNIFDILEAVTQHSAWGTTVFDTLSLHYRAPKPLALSHDEILTNAGAWKVISKGSKVSIEKVTLPQDLKMNVDASKLVTIKQVKLSCSNGFTQLYL